MGREPRGSSSMGEGEADSWKADPCFLFPRASSPPDCVEWSCIGGGVSVCCISALSTAIFIVVEEREKVGCSGHVQV